MLYLRPLSKEDGQEVYAMLQEIGSNENGFHNDVFQMDYEGYRAWLHRQCELDRGIDMPDWMVPQSSYWLFDGDMPIGCGRLRHRLNESLSAASGHIGYAVRHTQRGKGYGTHILRLLMQEAQKLEIAQLQVSANADNLPSNKVILRCAGILFRTADGRNFYHIDLKK